MTTKTKVPNILAREKSPYLLQHQYNPVDWFPWSEEAFSKAKAEDNLSSYLLGIAELVSHEYMPLVSCSL